MSIISEFASKQIVFNDRMDIAVTGITEDIKSLSDLVRQFQNSSGSISQEDQDLLDQIQVHAETIVEQLEALDALNPSSGSNNTGSNNTGSNDTGSNNTGSVTGSVLGTYVGNFSGSITDVTNLSVRTITSSLDGLLSGSFNGILSGGTLSGNYSGSYKGTVNEPDSKVVDATIKGVVSGTYTIDTISSASIARLMKRIK